MVLGIRRRHTACAQLAQERMQAEQGGHEQDATVAVRDVCRVHDGLHQQALGVYQDMALLALALLARAVARRVDAAPPFSALGLAPRPANSRQAMVSAW